MNIRQTNRRRQPHRRQPGRDEEPKADRKSRVRAATRVAFAQRCDRPIELTSLQIGDVYILNLCGECMVEFQLYAQKQRPTISWPWRPTATWARGTSAPRESFPEGGYEPRSSRSQPKFGTGDEESHPRTVWR